MLASMAVSGRTIAGAPTASPGARELGRGGAVRVLVNHCSAAKGEAVRLEQFAGASLSIVCSGVFGFRSEQGAQLLTTDFLLLGNPGQQYEISHEHAGGDRCLVFHFDEPVLAEI